MAQKFFENLNMNEIKIMLDLKMDPRYTSDIQKTTTNEELSRAMRAQQDNSFYQQLMQKMLPNIDFMVHDAFAVCQMTLHLWKTVVKHVDLFFDIINTHDLREGNNQIITVKGLLLKFKIQEVTVLKDIQAY